MPLNVSLAAPLLQCIDGCSQGGLGVCCGEADGDLYCFGSNCRCTDSTPGDPGGVACLCQSGFQGASCEQQVRRRIPRHRKTTARPPHPRSPARPPARPLAQVEPETTWLAIILTVGTMLILFIAWGFRCRSDDFDEDDDGRANTRAAARNPLIREQMDNVVAAAFRTSASRWSSYRAATRVLRYVPQVRVSA